MFFQADDDDSDFMVSGSSKLASLFVGESNQEGNQSLMYSAPRQPRKSKPQPQSSNETSNQSNSLGQLSVIYAAAVLAFKYEDGKPLNQGKVGAAILGNHETCLYRLLLYKGQQKKITVAAITNNFTLIVQQNNYATFYDDQRQTWSVNFDSSQTSEEFVKQIVLAKTNSANKSLDSLIIQDLKLGEGVSIETGDSVEIIFTGWLLTGFKLGQVFDSNKQSEKLLRLKLGKGKIIKGIEDGIVGMKKSGRRLIVIPPNLGYGLQGLDSKKIPPNSFLLFEVEVKKVKFSKEQELITSSTPIPSDSELPESRDIRTTDKFSSLSSSSEDNSIRARGASLSEQLSQSPDRKKATIISRIVKMGQPMLPVQGTATPQVGSDTENEEEPSVVVVTSSSVTSDVTDSATKPMPRPRTQSNLPQFTAQTDIPVCQPIPTIHNSIPFIMSNQQLQNAVLPAVPYSYPANTQFGLYSQPQSIAPSPVIVGSNENHMPLLLSETRTQNTELRIAISKMSDKIDSLLSKVDQSCSPLMNQKFFPSMETQTLMFNLQRIIEENEKLKGDLVEKNTKLEVQTEKINDLLQRNQRFLEQSNSILEERSTSIQKNASYSKLVLLEEEKDKLTRELSGTSVKLENLKKELSQSQNQLEEITYRNKESVTELQKSEEEIKKLHENIKELEAQKRELQNRLEASGENENPEEVSALQKRLVELELQISKESSDKQDGILEIGKLKSQISELTNQLSSFEEEKDKLKKEYEMQLETLVRELHQKQSPVVTGENSDVVRKVKKVMNLVYKHLKGEFESEENYNGAEICQILLETIRSVTSQLISSDVRETSETPIETRDSEITLKERTNQGDDTETKEIAKEVNDIKEVQPESRKTEVTEEKLEVSNTKLQDEEDEDDWRPQPPPPPLLTEDDDDDDWLT